jgi:hypothetical protein
MKTEFEVMQQLLKGKTLKHFSGFFVKFDDDGKLVYTQNKIAWGKKSGEVSFEFANHWSIEPEKYEFNGSLSRTNDCFKLNYISDISREIEVQLDKLSASKAKLKFTIELLD